MPETVPTPQRKTAADKIAEKLIYVERVNDTWIGVGVYK